MKISYAPSYTPKKMDKLLKLLREIGGTGEFIASILSPLYNHGYARPKEQLANIDLAIDILTSYRKDVVKEDKNTKQSIISYSEDIAITPIFDAHVENVLLEKEEHIHYIKETRRNIFKAFGGEDCKAQHIGCFQVRSNVYSAIVYICTRSFDEALDSEMEWQLISNKSFTDEIVEDILHVVKNYEEENI